MQAMSKEVILTGLRANGELHLGNYLGAIEPMVRLQKEKAGQFQLNMFVPDLHSFTTPIDHGQLYQNSIDNVKVFMAAGLDINQSDTFVYRQSFVPAHSEMTWILDCFTYFGEASRMVEFKEKSERASEGQNVSVGLFNYPVLMAADILLYDAKWVPVGEDQRQHLELARDLAMRMNNKFGELFTVPEETDKQLAFSGRDNQVRIRSLRNPEKKMSKSVDDPAGTILLSDNPDEAAKKIMAATTDSEGSIHYDMQQRPGVSNLLQILALLSRRHQGEVNVEWEGKQSYGDLKSAVADQVKQFLLTFQEVLGSISEDQLLQKLEADETAMREASNGKLARVQQAVGLRKA